MSENEKSQVQNKKPNQTQSQKRKPNRNKNRKAQSNSIAAQKQDSNKQKTEKPKTDTQKNDNKPRTNKPRNNRSRTNKQKNNNQKKEPQKTSPQNNDKNNKPKQDTQKNSNQKNDTQNKNNNQRNRTKKPNYNKNTQNKSKDKRPHKKNSGDDFKLISSAIDSEGWTIEEIDRYITAVKRAFDKIPESEDKTIDFRDIWINSSLPGDLILEVIKEHYEKIGIERGYLMLDGKKMFPDIPTPKLELEDPSTEPEEEIEITNNPESKEHT